MKLNELFPKQNKRWFYFLLMLPPLVFSCEEKSDYVPEKELPSIEQDVYNNSSIENRSEKEVNYEYRVDLTISAPFASEEVDDGSTGYRHLVEALLDENGGVLIEFINVNFVCL